MAQDKMLHGIDKSYLDERMTPGSDFYTYANGGWQQSHPLTAEYAVFGSFNELSERNREQVRDLITNLSENPESKKRGSIAQKISDLFAQGMDAERLNREGADPILPMIDKVETEQGEPRESLLGWLHNGISDGTFFSCGVGPDPIDAKSNILHIGEGGLSLGDRDYYLEDNKENRKIMAAFEIFVKRIMTLSGYSQKDSERIWHSVITIEREMAEHKLTREERRDPTKRYNPTDLQELKNMYPAFDWERYFKELGLKGIGKINISSPRFMEYISAKMPELDSRMYADYMVYSLVCDSCGVLSDDFTDASFELYGRVMSGREEKRPRWKRAMAIPTSMFSEAVGKLYVEKYFPESSKNYMKELVERLRNSLRGHIENLEWMSDATKTKAIDKLESMGVKIGYPDKWKDYSEIEIDPALSYAENVVRASIWFTQDNFSKLSKPVDRDEWFMAPHTVNAYYSPMFNEICFPAGILQPPFFDPESDHAMNYGAVGVVIGHEMTHGFDDQGRKFDKEGNMADWWTREDEDKFNALGDKLVAQFDEVEVAPGVHANGRFTLGENIADQGGLRIAETAYTQSFPDAGIIDGFSPLQRFYISYANVWASNIRPEEILLRTKTDPHSLARNRVNVTLRNITPFFEAFGLNERDAMWRPENERVIIW